MLKFIESTPQASRLERKFLSEIPIGATFYAKPTENSIDDILFLRVFGGIISLKYPSDTWFPGGGYEKENFRKFDVFDYRPVDVECAIKEIK